MGVFLSLEFKRRKSRFFPDFYSTFQTFTLISRLFSIFDSTFQIFFRLLLYFTDFFWTFTLLSTLFSNFYSTFQSFTLFSRKFFYIQFFPLFQTLCEPRLFPLSSKLGEPIFLQSPCYLCKRSTIRNG